MLKMVHPFMPFVTEEIYQLMPVRRNLDEGGKERNAGESISTSEFPELKKELMSPQADKEMETVVDIVTAIRNIRGEMNIPPSKKITVLLKSSEVSERQIDYIKKLARVEDLKAGDNVTKPKASASSVVKSSEIYIPLEGLIDLDVERQRLQKEITRLEGSLAGIEKKLSNEKFVSGAPAEVVEKERTKQRDWQDNLRKLKEIFRA
ncbi:MAG: class I tRNA ligase family protein [Ignavibacteriaceae bacterium]|nr:class I tRNA ligase family protein [Ignavibacteriaceae bacterium]